MLSKFVDVVLDLLKFRYKPRARLAREVQRLNQSLESSHKSWVAFSSHTHFDVHDNAAALEKLDANDRDELIRLRNNHRDSTQSLMASLKKLDFVLDTYCPEAKRDIGSYAAVEAAMVAEPESEIQSFVHMLEEDSPRDYETAEQRLREFIRTTFKPEEFY